MAGQLEALETARSRVGAVDNPALSARLARLEADADLAPDVAAGPRTTVS